MITLMPSLWRFLTASMASGFMASATITVPSPFSLVAKTNCGPPSNDKPISAINLKLPAKYSTPSIVPFNPFPCIISKCETGNGATFFFLTYSTIAWATGCSDLLSSEANTCIILSSDTLVTSGLPLVMVPVLSTTTISTLWSFSNVAASLIKIPSFAPLPTPTIIAVGVASPSAQGQAITRIPTNDTSPRDSACENPSICVPKVSQMPRVTNEIINTIGTKIPEILSASACIGARLPCASSTILMIWARKVSEPTFVVLNVKALLVLIVPVTTLSPIFFSTGIGSPVTMASSINEEPSTIIPSTGILAPGFTITKSQCTTSLTEISTSLLFLITRAVFACR